MVVCEAAAVRCHLLPVRSARRCLSRTCMCFLLLEDSEVRLSAKNRLFFGLEGGRRLFPVRFI